MPDGGCSSRAAIAGLIGAIAITSLLNQRISSSFEATAELAVLPDAGGDVDDLENKRLDILDQALIVNQSRLLNSNNLIETAPDDTAIINFTSVASSEELARERAETMRGDTETTLDEQRQTSADENRLQQQIILDRLEEIEELIREQEGLRTPNDIDTQVDVQLLQGEFQAVNNELSALYVERTTGADITEDPLRTLVTVEAEITALEAKYRDLQRQISDQSAVQGNIQFNPIDRQISLLTNEYNARIQEYGTLVLSAGSKDVLSVGPATVVNITSSPGSAVTNGVAGLIAGLLAAFGLMVVYDKYRQHIWVGTDLRTVPFMGEVPQRAAPLVAGQAWYEFGGPAQRKRSIQSARVTVENATESGSALGFVGVAPSADLHELAADFAMSMVTSGSRVLLIDADFDHPSGLFEFSGQGATISDLLQFRLDDEESYRAFIKRSLTEAAEVTDGLTAVQVGTGLADPADAMSGRRLQIVLEEVRRLFDLTVFVAGGGSDATALATMTRMDGAIFGIRPGTARQGQVEDLHRQLATFGVPVLGGVLLTRSGGGSHTPGAVPDPVAEPPSRRRSTSDSDAQDLLVEALLRERTQNADELAPESDADESDDSSDEPLEEDPFATLRPTDSSGNLAPATVSDLSLVSTLAPASTGDPSEAVASLLSSTIEQVLRGFSGPSNQQRVDPGIAEVTKYGFVPMVRVKGHKTIGARVLDALNAKIESAERSQLISEFVTFFGIDPGGRSNERVVTAINEWTREHFFTRHLVDTGREPAVWHVASQRRTFEALVHVNRCTKERIDLFRSEILRRHIDAMNKSMKAASKARRTEEVRILEERIKDVRTFDIAWGWLFEGTTPAARLWYPWKGPEAQPQGWDPNFDEGVRANVAPLQRLNVLAQDVLTSEELLALSPPS